jgi:LysM repeat protein
MKYLLLLASALAATACTASPTTVPGPSLAPTATLRALPTITASPFFATALPTDTPQATFTPLPTATPLAYIVKQGDTLLGIAIQHSLTIEALEAVNPGINPTTLQIGQTVFIPPTTQDTIPNQAQAPTPLPVTVAPFNCSPSPVTSVICLGEFVNQLDQPVANLSVKVTLLDSNNNPVDSQVAYAPLDLVLPGAAAPLSVVFSTGSQHQAFAAVLTADSGAELTGYYAALTVSDVSSQPMSGGLTLTATITNSTPNPVKNVVVVGTVYNAAGAVTGFRALKLPDQIASNTSTSVELVLPGVTVAARWVIVSQGRIP